MRKISAFAFFLILCTACDAQAAEKPSEIATIIRANTPYGEGQLRRLMMTIYDADLWTDAESWSWQKPFAVTLHYHMSLDGSDLSARSIQEIIRQSSLSDAQKTNYTGQLNALLPDVQKGDEITALFIPNKETRVFHNGQPTGVIQDQLFAKLFLSIWLGEKTSEPTLRQQLLALSSHDTRNIQ
jgi:hypothetical protein